MTDPQQNQKQPRLVERLLRSKSLPKPIDPVQVSGIEALAKAAGSDMLLAASLCALATLIDQIPEANRKGQVRQVIQSCILKTEELMAKQRDAILHHPQFQELERSWRSVSVLVLRTPEGDQTRIRIAHLLKEALRNDLFEKDGITPKPLYRSEFRNRIFNYAYDRYGEIPIALVVGDYEFDITDPKDIALLEQISAICAESQCLFLASLNKANMDEILGRPMEELDNLLGGQASSGAARYRKWNEFRDKPTARYVGLTIGRPLLREPYDTKTYREDVCVTDVNTEDLLKNYLWGNAAFLLASNALRCFAEDGWCVRIAGPDAGKIDHLPTHKYELAGQEYTKGPVDFEVTGQESLENKLGSFGIIPLVGFPRQSSATFIEPRSAYRPINYGTKTEEDVRATENEKLIAALPHMFLMTRIAHHLKLTQRNKIGGFNNTAGLKAALEDWLKTIQNINPGDKERPLKNATVQVSDIPGEPGFFKVDIGITPHPITRGMVVNLNLEGRMPKAK